MRACDYCKNNSKQIDDEINFLFDCEQNDKERRIFLKQTNVSYPCLINMTYMEKVGVIKNILINDSLKGQLISLAKFVFVSEELRKIINFLQCKVLYV